MTYVTSGLAESSKKHETVLGLAQSHEACRRRSGLWGSHLMGEAADPEYDISGHALK